MENKVNSKRKFFKIIPRGSRSPHNVELGHLPRCFPEDGKEMYKELQRKCTAIVLAAIVRKVDNSIYWID